MRFLDVLFSFGCLLSYPPPSLSLSLSLSPSPLFVPASITLLSCLSIPISSNVFHVSAISLSHLHQHLVDVDTIATTKSPTTNKKEEKEMTEEELELEDAKLPTMNVDQKMSYFRDIEFFALYEKYDVKFPPQVVAPTKPTFVYKPKPKLKPKPKPNPNPNPNPNSNSKPQPVAKKLLMQMKEQITDHDTNDQQMQTQMQGQQQVSLLYPASALGLPGSGGISAATARTQIQGQPDANFMGGAYNLFTLDAAGRVTGVSFLAGEMMGTRKKLTKRVTRWCDVAYNHGKLGGDFYNYGDGNTRNRYVWQCGHIVASALGGSHNHPMNFIPMHASCNNGGRYYQAEMMAGALVVLIKKCTGAVHRIQVDIHFEYADATRPFTPSGGDYVISVAKVDVDGCLAKQKLAIKDPVAIFLKHSEWDGTGNWLQLAMEWLNQSDLPAQDTEVQRIGGILDTSQYVDYQLTFP